MNDLETIIRSALQADAERAPTLDEEWTGPAVLTSAEPTSRPHARLLRLGLAAAAVSVGILVAVNRPSPEQSAETAASVWSPPGIEFPSQDLGVPDSAPALTTSSLTRSIGVEGHATLTVYTGLGYQGGRTATIRRCVGVPGGASCMPEWHTGPSGSTAVTSSWDAGAADEGLWIWQDVPAETAYVTYGSADQMRWQRPIFGVVVFPNMSPGATGIAYSASGDELARINDAVTTSEAADVDPPLLADITRGEFDELSVMTDVTLRDCLVAAGATIAGEIATVPNDQQVWESCVQSTKQTVAQRIDALNPRFYDARSEQPLSPEPAFFYPDGN